MPDPESGGRCSIGRGGDVLAPGSRRLDWRGLVKVEVERVSLADGLVVRADVAWSPDAHPIGAYFTAGEIF